jgi:hypothetical protein
MKRKRVAMLLVGVGLIGTAWLVHSNWHRLFPSPQMKSLRQLETDLDLPKPKFRSEEDLGYHKDSKGAAHYDRHIALSYDDVSVLNTLRSKLLNDSWQEGPVEEPVGSDTHFSFKKGTGDGIQCVNGYTKPDDHDVSLYISLEASGEYVCNPAPGI